MQIKISNLQFRPGPSVSFDLISLRKKEAAEAFDCTLGSRAELVDPKDDGRRWV